MGTHRYIIRDASFSEHVYRVLTTITAEQKKALDNDDLKALSTPVAIGQFVHNAPMERLLMLLTKVGKYWDLRTYDEPDDVNQLEFNIINQFQFPQKRVEVTEAMARKKIFYLSSSDTMHAAMMAAQNCHTKVYDLATNSRALAKKVSSAKAIKVPYEVQIDQVTEGYNNLSSLLLAQLSVSDWAKYTLHLDETRVRILCALFLKRNSAFAFNEVVEATLMLGQPALVKQNLAKLLKDKLITSDANHGPKIQGSKGGKAVFKKTYYMITTQGIKRIMEYSNYVHQIAFKN